MGAEKMRFGLIVTALLLTSAPAVAADPVYVTEGERKPASEVFQAIEVAKHCGLSTAPLGTIPAAFDKWVVAHTYKDRFLPDLPAVESFADRRAKALQGWSTPGYKEVMCPAVRAKSAEFFANTKRSWAWLVSQHAAALPTTGHRGN